MPPVHAPPLVSLRDPAPSRVHSAFTLPANRDWCSPNDHFGVMPRRSETAQLARDDAEDDDVHVEWTPPVTDTTPGDAVKAAVGVRKHDRGSDEEVCSPVRHPRPPSADMRYGAMEERTGYLRQDTRPVPFVSVKVRRFVHLSGTRLSLSKGPRAEIIWSYDIAGAEVDTYATDKRISIWLTDSMRHRRRVIVLCTNNEKNFMLWSIWLKRAAEAVLERHYEMNEYINTGSFARVVLGRDLHNGREVAIKLIEKSNSSRAERKYMEREVAIMSRVRHPNIVRCLDIFDTHLRTRIVMEFMAGGMLSDIIAARQGKPVPEHEARHVLHGVLSAVRYLHANGIVHRDIKPSNILLARKEFPFGAVKLSDFGLSNFVSRSDGSSDDDFAASLKESTGLHPGSVFGPTASLHGADERRDPAHVPANAPSALPESGTSADPSARGGHVGVTSSPTPRSGKAGQPLVLSSAVGSPAFVAPELFDESYGPAVDLWAVGVVMYIMLAGGSLPFKGSTSTAVVHSVKKGAIDMSQIPATRVSADARNLLLSLLVVDPARRMTAADALKHPWITAGSSGPSEGETDGDSGSENEVDNDAENETENIPLSEDAHRPRVPTLTPHSYASPLDQAAGGHASQAKEPKPKHGPNGQRRRNRPKVRPPQVLAALDALDKKKGHSGSEKKRGRKPPMHPRSGHGGPRAAVRMAENHRSRTAPSIGIVAAASEEHSGASGPEAVAMPPKGLRRRGMSRMHSPGHGLEDRFSRRSRHNTSTRANSAAVLEDVDAQGEEHVDMTVIHVDKLSADVDELDPLSADGETSAGISDDDGLDEYEDELGHHPLEFELRVSSDMSRGANASLLSTDRPLTFAAAGNAAHGVSDNRPDGFQPDTRRHAGAV